MSRHWFLLTVLGFCVSLIAIGCIWWAYGRVVLAGRYKSRSAGAPGSTVASILRPGASLWRRLGAAVFALSAGSDSIRGKEDFNKREYELLERHEV